MPPRFEVVVIGDANVDLVLGEITGDVALGRSSLAGDYALTVGGSAANCACACARLGLKTCLVAKIGTDDFGAFVLGGLAAAGVSTENVVVSHGARTGLTVAITGEDRGFLSFRGAVATLVRSDIGRLPNARVLHVAGYHATQMLRPAISDLVADARRSGAMTSLDVDWDPADKWSDLGAQLGNFDILFTNAQELERLAEGPDVETRIGRLAHRSPMVVTKLGAEGAMAADGARIVKRPSFAAEVIDTTGAGDCFNAGFLFAHLAGHEVPLALDYANAAGSLATERLGLGPAAPTLSEVEGRRAAR